MAEEMFQVEGLDAKQLFRINVGIAVIVVVSLCGLYWYYWAVAGDVPAAPPSIDVKRITRSGGFMSPRIQPPPGDARGH